MIYPGSRQEIFAALQVYSIDTHPLRILFWTVFSRNEDVIDVILFTWMTRSGKPLCLYRQSSPCHWPVPIVLFLTGLGQRPGMTFHNGTRQQRELWITFMCWSSALKSFQKTWHVLCVINFIQHFFWLYFVLCAQLLKGKFPPFWSFMEGPGGSEAYGNASELEAIIFNGTSLQPEAQMGHVEMEEILHQLRLVVYPIIYRVWYIPGGAGYQPSTVVFMSLNLFVAGEDCMITVFDTISCLHVWNSESDVGADGCFQVWSSSSGGHDIQSWSLVAILWLILHRYLHHRYLH